MKEYKYIIDGQEYIVEIGDINENIADVKVNGETFKVQMETEPDPEKKKTVLGQPTAQEEGEGEPSAPVHVNSNDAVKAPLPGTITGINVKVGDKVKAGDTVVVLEAMKMANNIEAEKDGTVTAVCVKLGQAVMEEDPLVVIE